MKRWLSISFALGAFVGVLSVSAVAFSQLRLGTLNVPSVPVSTRSTTDKTVPIAVGDFADAEAFFADKGITISTQPKATLSWATWNTYPVTTDDNVRHAASELKAEWLKYENNTLKATGLKAIYLVNNLRVGGQARSGMPDPISTHALYFDISDGYLYSEDGDYMRRTFHHEFRHLIEYHLTGSYEPKDEAWANCNAQNTIYGKGGSAMYDNPEFAHSEHPSYGFIDGYATSAKEEDKAEIFAYYMTDPAYIQELAKTDAGIACKLAQTTKLLQSL